jgi:two-component system, sporulation sensor kinase E
MRDNLTGTLLLVNFGLLAFALLAVYYYAYRLKMELNRVEFLRTQNDSYRDLFEATSDVVFQVDTDTNFKVVNRATAKVLGFESPEALLETGDNIRRFFAEPAESDLIFNQIKQGMPIKNRVVKVRNRNGVFLYISVTLHAVRDAKGVLIGVHGIGHDVTQRIALEEELWNYSINLEKMVQEKARVILDLERKKFHLEKLASVGETVSSLVHELRNPLSTMKMGYLTLKKTNRFDDSEKHYLDLIEKEGHRLEVMLKDVLDFAKPQELRLIPQELHPVMEQAIERFRGEFGKEGIVVRREFAGALPRVSVDAERLSQVLVNLLQNAMEAARGADPRIVVRTAHLQDQEAVRIEVSDNGVGIAENLLPKVFEPFFTGRKTGTGLGLTVVQKIVEAHRGRVAIKSRPGKGTTVQIDLPAIQGPGREPDEGTGKRLPEGRTGKTGKPVPGVPSVQSDFI